MATPKAVECKIPTCDGNLLWVWTDRAKREGRPKRNLCLDEEPIPWEKGAWRFVEDEVVALAREGDDGPFFRSHWGTCADPDYFRRGGRR